MFSFSFSHFIIGLLLAGAGLLGVKFTYPIMNFTGRQQWIEKYTGQGTTYFVMKMFFLVVLLFGILFAFGLGGALLSWVFSPLRKIFSPAP